MGLWRHFVRRSSAHAVRFSVGTSDDFSSSHAPLSRWYDGRRLYVNTFTAVVLHHRLDVSLAVMSLVGVHLLDLRAEIYVQTSYLLEDEKFVNIYRITTLLRWQHDVPIVAKFLSPGAPTWVFSELDRVHFDKHVANTLSNRQNTV
jgi:hypothetical protein